MKKKILAIGVIIIIIATIIIVGLLNNSKSQEELEIEELQFVINIIRGNGEEYITVDNLNEYLRENGVMATAVKNNRTMVVFDNGNKYEVELDGTITKGGRNLTSMALGSDDYEINVKFLEEATNIITDKPNSPQLSEEMIPIKWNGENWIITTKDDPEWYNYISQTKDVDKTSKWANIMLSDGKYSNITKDGKILVTTENIGTIIKDDELGSMYVWIPRYAYKISYYKDNNLIASSDSRGFVDAKGELINEANNQGTRIGVEDNYMVHPSFLGKGHESIGGGFGDDENGISGFWVAKFEASNKNITNYNEDVELTAQDSILRSIPSSLSGTVEYDMEKLKENVIEKAQGQSTNSTDMHIMKNSELGATIYLAYSSYGRNGNLIDINESYYNIENGSSVTGYGKSDDNYYYMYNQKDFSYRTEKGMLASSTGNIYGIYDLAGGNAEFTMSFKNDNEDIQKLIEGIEPKYYMLYKNNKSDESNVGDIVFETESWYRNGADYVNSYEPIFKMGGRYDVGCAGMFNYSAWNETEVKCGFRTTIILK